MEFSLIRTMIKEPHLSSKLGQGMAFRYQDSEERRECNLTIPAELAYGEAGFPPTIPPSATLQFNWSYSWSSVKDICKDEGIAKEVLTEAETWENPKDLGEVLVIQSNMRLDMSMEV